MAAMNILESVARDLAKTRVSGFRVHANSAFTRSNSTFQPHFDYARVKANAEYISSNIQLRKSPGDVRSVTTTYSKYSEVLRTVDALRQERNKIASDKKLSADDKQSSGKRIKEQLAALEQELADAKSQLQHAAMRLPCDTHPDAPVGPESAARTIMTIGQPRQYDFAPKDHVTLGKALGLFDLQAASSISGSAFSVLTGYGALLELALVQWAMGQAAAAGFLPVLPPDLAHVGLVEGCGFNPRDEEGGALSQVYRLAGSDLCLIGTSEIPLAGMHAGQLLQAAELPKAYAAFSHCFRREAGGAGSATRGLYRLHQFSKVELFAFLSPGVTPPAGHPLHVDSIQHQELVQALVHKGPDKTSVDGAPGPATPVLPTDSALACLVDFQARLLSSLGLHARVLDMPTEELGAAAYRKVDCEAWMPGRMQPGATPGTAPGVYGEVTSASNCMDYQARRLNMRVRMDKGDKADKGEKVDKSTAFLHTLNGTALAVPRVIIALLETHQQRDGSVRLPDCLVPYMHGQQVLKPTASGR